MATYLLTWQPKDSPWHELFEQAETTKNGQSVKRRWSCGVTKRIKIGDRLFLYRQGKDKPGFIGSALAISTPYEDTHWKPELAAIGKKALYVQGEYDTILHAEEPPLERTALDPRLAATLKWDTQSSGITIQDGLAEEIESEWRRHLMQIRPAGPSPSVPEYADEDETAFPEGKQAYRQHRMRERNPLVVEQAKARAKQKHGYLFCCVCGFDFGTKYGALGADFIEGHHTQPLSEYKEGDTTKVEDIALVCSNCHRMLHRKRPWLTINDLKSLITV